MKEIYYKIVAVVILIATIAMAFIAVNFTVNAINNYRSNTVKEVYFIKVIYTECGSFLNAEDTMFVSDSRDTTELKWWSCNKTDNFKVGEIYKVTKTLDNTNHFELIKTE